MARYRRQGIAASDAAFAVDFQLAEGRNAALRGGGGGVSLVNQTAFGDIYYTLDGSKVMVVTNYIAQEDVGDNGVHFYDPETWELIEYVNVPWPGADDADLTADGRYLAISAEYSGYLAFIDTEEMTLAGATEIGSLPRDVRLSPDGKTFYVTNEGLGGIQTVDAETWELTDWCGDHPAFAGLWQ